ncbi:hypothetical protein [Alteromonas sp. S015]|uniref:hypothetical protein n=1 Tax=Alteromonas sp. S015 TaxID=3117401 RepID=UPI002FE426A3
MGLRHSIFLFGVFISTTVSASISTDELETCISIQNDNKRLSCFDRYAKQHLAAQEDKFGATKYKDVETQKTFVISDAKKINGMYIITLDNNQRWKQMEVSRTLSLQQNDVVEISSGALTSYFLKKQGSRMSVKFKRIE